MTTAAILTLALMTAPGCDDNGTPGLIGEAGGCWHLGKHEALYGKDGVVWYIRHLHDVGVIDEPEMVRWLIRAAWPDRLEEDAIRVAECESGFNPRAANMTGTDLTMNGGSLGLFQQGRWFWASRAEQAGIPGADVFDPYHNAVVSAWLQQVGGWGHWSCARIVGII